MLEPDGRIYAGPAYNRHLKLELLRWDEPRRSVPFGWLCNPQNELVDYTCNVAGNRLLVAIFSSAVLASTDPLKTSAQAQTLILGRDAVGSCAGSGCSVLRSAQ